MWELITLLNTIYDILRHQSREKSNQEFSQKFINFVNTSKNESNKCRGIRSDIFFFFCG